MAEGVKRRYDSSRRQEQAHENRRRIIASAQALFVDKGYGRTTIADIAGKAGVAAETVYAAFRNKPTLLHRACGRGAVLSVENDMQEGAFGPDVAESRIGGCHEARSRGPYPVRVGGTAHSGHRRTRGKLSGRAVGLPCTTSCQYEPRSMTCPMSSSVITRTRAS